MDPLAKQEFDSYIVEQMQKQRTMQLHKKTSIVSGKDEQAPKHSFAASLDDGSRKALQSKLKSSIRKARDDKDKTDNAE